MSETEELKKIKKTYGEKFMHLCRKFFPTILEEEGRLYEILTTLFSDNCKCLYEDITLDEMELEFRTLVFDMYRNMNSRTKEVETDKSPYELLDEAGYTLYECKSEEEIQRFKKYYYPGEELCTFRGDRLNECVVFFAVKKDVDSIKREDFKKTKRQDEYGTSVISIQFYRKPPSVVSIKNRYNHKVHNPDATFGNDLEMIAPGLRYSFKELLKERGIILDSSNIQQFELQNYIKAADGKLYKFNSEELGVYSCPGNIIIKNGEACKIGDPEKIILIDGYVIDLKNKTISALKEFETQGEDSFLTAVQNIKSIKVEKDKKKGNGARIITVIHEDEKEPTIIEINGNNQITGLTCSRITHIDNNFLKYSEGLAKISLPNLKSIGDFQGLKLEEVDIPNVETIGDNFLFYNKEIKNLKLPKVKKIGNCFGSYSSIETIEIPLVEEVGTYFLSNADNLKTINADNLRLTGDSFIKDAGGKDIRIVLPRLEEAGDDFCANSEAGVVITPSLRKAGKNFLQNSSTRILSANNLEVLGNWGLTDLGNIQVIYMEKLKMAGERFCANNGNLSEACFPELESVGKCSFTYNPSLGALSLPVINELGEQSINYCDNLVIFNAPELQKIDEKSLECHRLSILGLPKLEGKMPFICYLPTVRKIGYENCIELDKVIRSNCEKKHKQGLIKSMDLSLMDKHSEICSSEIEIVQKELEERKDKEKNKN